MENEDLDDGWHLQSADTSATYLRHILLDQLFHASVFLFWLAIPFLLPIGAVWIVKWQSQLHIGSLFVAMCIAAGFYLVWLLKLSVRIHIRNNRTLAMHYTNLVVELTKKLDELEWVREETWERPTNELDDAIVEMELTLAINRLTSFIVRVESGQASALQKNKRFFTRKQIKTICDLYDSYLVKFDIAPKPVTA